jgi:hypothetical protein
MNKYSFEMNSGWYFIYINQLDKNEETYQNFTHFSVKLTALLFTESDKSFKILEEYFLNLLYNLQYNGYRYDTLLSSICVTLSHDFLKCRQPMKQ